MSSRRIAKSVRGYRRIHKLLGIVLSLLLLISALTGILLAWKKNFDSLQPPTQKGDILDLLAYKSVKELADVAVLAVDSLGLTHDNLDRVEYRPTKGVAKVIFNTGNWEVQVDASTLDVLSVAKRHSDWIEHIHDGSIVSDIFKLISMNFLGFGLIVLLLSGLWLWYGPKRIRFLKKRP